MATRHGNAFQRSPFGFFRRGPHGFRDRLSLPSLMFVFFQDEATYSPGDFAADVEAWEALAQYYPVRLWFVQVRAWDGEVLDVTGGQPFPSTYAVRTGTPRPITGFPTHIESGLTNFFHRFRSTYGNGTDVDRLEIYVDDSGSMTTEDVGTTPFQVAHNIHNRNSVGGVEGLPWSEILIKPFGHEQWVLEAIFRTRAYYAVEP